jgi:hypothetical protein
MYPRRMYEYIEIDISLNSKLQAQILVFGIQEWYDCC